jgi:hypothetical protein
VKLGIMINKSIDGFVNFPDLFILHYKQISKHFIITCKYI